MAILFNLNQIQKLVGRAIFFDANVLIYIFWPTGNHQWIASYSKAFHTLLKQQNPLALDFRVVSEIVNRVFKIEYEKYKSSLISGDPIAFKQFRNSSDGQQILNDLYLILKNDILPKFKVVGKAIEKQEIESFLVVDSLDFADKAIVQTCADLNLVLFTNDIDFKTTDLTVLSGSRY